MTLSLIVTGAATAAYVSASASGVPVGAFVASIVGSALTGLGLGGGAMAWYQHNLASPPQATPPLPETQKASKIIKKKIKHLPQQLEQANKPLIEDINKCQKTVSLAAKQMKHIEQRAVPKIQHAVKEAKQATKSLNDKTLPELKKARDEANKTKSNIDNLTTKLQEKEQLLLQAQKQMEAINTSLKAQEKNNNHLGQVVEKKSSTIGEQALIIGDLKGNLEKVRASSKKLESHSKDLETGILTLQQEVERLEADRKQLLEKNKALESKNYHLNRQWRDSATLTETNKSHIKQLEQRHAELISCLADVKIQYQSLEGLYSKYKVANQTLLSKNEELSQNNLAKQQLLDEVKPHMEKATKQLKFFKSIHTDEKSPNRNAKASQVRIH